MMKLKENIIKRLLKEQEGDDSLNALDAFMDRVAKELAPVDKRSSDIAKADEEEAPSTTGATGGSQSGGGKGGGKGEGTKPAINPKFAKLYDVAKPGAKLNSQEIVDSIKTGALKSNEIIKAFKGIIENSLGDSLNKDLLNDEKVKAILKDFLGE